MPHLLYPYKTVLIGGAAGDPSAVINWDFLQSQSLTSFSRTSNATLFDSTGKLTYAANNLLVSTATLSTQTVTTGLQAGMNVILSFYGTGSVSISGGYTGSLAGTGVSDRVYLKFTTTTASLTFTVSGSVTNAQLEAVTYQTTPSAYVYNTTTPSSQYYGPRYPYAYNGSTWDAQGLLAEQAATNVLTYSQTLATDWTDTNITRVSTTRTSPDGTGNALEVSASAGNATIIRNAAVGSSALRVLSVYLKRVTGTGDIQYTLDNGSTWTTQAITSSWVLYSFPATSADQRVGFRIVTSGDAIQIWGTQLEAGSSPTSYIPNLATGTTTRNADTSLAFSAITLPTGLSFSRTSNAMQFDAAGFLTYAPNNLLTYSNTFSNAAWTKTSITVTGGQTDPLGGSNASTLTASGANGTCVQTTAAFAVNGQNALWIKRKTGSGTIQLSKPDGTLTTLTITSSWAQYTANYQGASATGDFTIKIVTSGDEIDVYSASQAKVTYETIARPGDDVITTSTAYYGPRYDYDPLTRLPKGLLIEEARTNLAVYSEKISSSGWSLYNVTRSATTTGPNGVSDSAQTIKATASNSYHFAYTTSTVSITSGATYTLCAYVKAGTSRYVNLIAPTANNHYATAVFDVGDSTKTEATQTEVGSSSGTIVATSQVNVGSGWYRVAMTFSVSGTALTVEIGLAGAATGNSLISSGEVTFNAAGTEDISVFGLQLEAGSFPTSYIPNPGIGSGARTADLPDSTNATVIGCKTFLVETNGMQAATTATMLGLNTGIGLGETTGNALTTAFGGTQTTTATATWTGIVRSGIAWGASKVSITFNGNDVTTAGNSTSALTTISLGHTNNAGTRGAFMNGWIRKAAGYSSALSDASLKTKSTVGATF